MCDKTKMWKYDEEGGYQEYFLEDASLEEQRMHYGWLCSNTEIDRIINLKNGSDYLLKLSANIVIDHPRIMRYYSYLRHYVESKKMQWSFEKCLYFRNYGEFLSMLSKDNKEKCSHISYGLINSNEVNGQLFKSPYGICSTMSVYMRYFCEFSHLALLFDNNEVPIEIKFNALRIAIRLMLGIESLDFEMDPRGIVPNKIKKEIYRPYPFQSIFIAGHEFSHHLLNHLDENNTTLRTIHTTAFWDQNDCRKIYEYNVQQQHELDADISALNLPLIKNEDYYYQYYYSVLLWFASLHILEGVEDSINPPNGYVTHPGAIKRYNNIIENARRPKLFDEELFCKRLPELSSFWRNKMIEDVSFHIELYEKESYGSLYLAKPNTKWRGKELRDRIDY
ncbi:MAG: hypothetical protein IKO56_05145 [Alphaproteobacteria bacterium]|nr:hypothetical protein [Alphaproteobacteria bacterium]